MYLVDFIVYLIKGSEKNTCKVLLVVIITLIKTVLYNMVYILCAFSNWCVYHAIVN